MNPGHIRDWPPQESRPWLAFLLRAQASFSESLPSYHPRPPEPVLLVAGHPWRGEVLDPLKTGWLRQSTTYIDLRNDCDQTWNASEMFMLYPLATSDPLATTDHWRPVEVTSTPISRHDDAFCWGLPPRPELFLPHKIHLQAEPSSG